MTDPSLVVEKYLIQRMTAHTRIHQAALEAFYETVRHLPVEQAEALYFQSYRERVRVDAERYEAQHAEVWGNSHMGYSDKLKEERKITPATQPAWPQSREEAFIKAYGDPRVNSAELYTTIRDWQRPFRTQRRPDNASTFQQARTPWELHSIRMILQPLDGSVPVFMLNEHGQPMAPDLVFGEPRGEYAGVNRSYYDPLVGREGFSAGGRPGAYGSPQDVPPPHTPTPPSIAAQLPEQPVIAVGAPPPTPVAAADLRVDRAPTAPVQLVAPEGFEWSEDKRLRKAQETVIRNAAKALNNICPICYEPKPPAGMKSHQVACAKKHGVALPTPAAVA